jgi:predicted ATPase/class 3 adenylate cyclase
MTGEPSTAESEQSDGAGLASTVTLMFTDIVGSTSLLRESRNAYADVLSGHRRVLRAAFADHSGREIDTQGDSFFVTFPTAAEAVAAAAQAQRSLAAEHWPDGLQVLVRIGLHTGEATLAGGSYIGLAVHRAARIAAAAAGGQIVLSDVTAAMVEEVLPPGTALRSLGEHRLRDFPRPSVLFQLDVAGLPTAFPPLRTARQDQLPGPRDALLGRDADVAALTSLLSDERTRLVTVTGPGGIGKTRVAVESARAAAGLFPGGVMFVPLSSVVDACLVSSTIADALGARREPGVDPVEAIRAALGKDRTLLLLDNFEQVVTAAGELAALLDGSPGAVMLVTSRQALRLRSEHRYPLAPLALRAAERLFAERAAAVHPGFTLDASNSAAVTEICRRLDGLPLAIELAAARLRVLTPRQIADRLDDRFRLLTSGSRTVLPRQQTLRAVVDWSWELLDERERTLLREVSVFAGGWDLEAAEAVCTGPAAELLGALVDKSLIVATPDERDGLGGMRYRMLETIHEYAVERAAECPELRATAELRHRAWVRALVEEAEPQLRSAGQLPWISRLETELDNIRAAVDRALTAGDETQAAALVLAMGWFWWLRNYRREGLTWVDRVLRLGVVLDEGAMTDTGQIPCDGEAGDPVDAYLAAADKETRHPAHRRRMNLRMLHLFLKAETESMDDDLDPRLRRYVELVRNHFAQGGPDAARLPGIVWPMIGLMLKDPVDIRPLMDTSVAHCRAHGDDWAVAVALMFRTHLVVDSPGGMAGVDDDLAELRVLSRRVGDRWLRAQVSSAAGEAAMARGRPAEAKEEYEESLRLAHEVGAYAETPFLVARLAEVAYRTGDRATALTTLDEASAAGDLYGVPETRAFVRLMRAHIALEDKDTARARELVDAVREQVGESPSPPQFTVMLKSVAAMVTAAESGPEHGLPLVADTVREAIEKRCSDMVVATLVDAAAALLCDLGDLPRVVRLIAAAERRRGGDPRPHPERVEVERAQATARTVLGPVRYAAEHARGTALTPDEVLAELDEVARARAS